MPLTAQTIPDVTAPDAFTREDGSHWHAAIVHQDGSATVADTLTELVATVVVGYVESEEKTLLDLRYDFAVRVADVHQAFLAFAKHDSGEFDHVAAGEEVLTALFTSRGEYIPDFDRWDAAVPLVLIATDFAPYTERERPEGEILWVDPATELTFLQSLASVDLIQLWVHETV